MWGTILVTMSTRWPGSAELFWPDQTAEKRCEAKEELARAQSKEHIIECIQGLTERPADQTPPESAEVE